MNHIDQSLNRLLKTAAKAPSAELNPPSPHLEVRVLAHWRATKSEDWSELLPWFFRRAVLCAGVIVLSVVGWGMFQNRTTVPGSTALAGLNNSIQVMPWVK